VGFEALQPISTRNIIGYWLMTGNCHAEESLLFEVNLASSCKWILTYIALTEKRKRQQSMLVSLANN
jgi:hypothetical protein